MATEFHLSPSQVEKELPEDIADFLAYHKVRVNAEAEEREKTDRKTKTKKKGKLSNLEEAIRRDADKRK